MTTAPAVMSRPPATAGTVSFSPSSSHAKTITSGTLSLSSGATRDAGPSCKGAEVAEPRKSGGHSGEHEIQESAPVEQANFAVLAERQCDGPCEYKDDGGAYGGGKV